MIPTGEDRLGPLGEAGLWILTIKPTSSGEAVALADDQGGEVGQARGAAPLREWHEQLSMNVAMVQRGSGTSG